MIMPDVTYPLNKTQALHILEHLPDALIVVDAEQLVQYLNQAARQLLDGDDIPADTSLDTLVQEHDLRAIPLPEAPSGLQLFRLVAEVTSEEAEPVKTPARLDALLDALGIGMLVLDEQDRVIAINQTGETLVGKSNVNLLHHEIGWVLPGLSPYDLASLKTSATRHSPGFEHRHRRLVARWLNRDGQHILTLFDLSPFQFHDLERVGLLRFIVHDLSNPLNIAINFADLMAEDLLEGAELEQGTQIVARQLHRIHTLLEDLSLLDQVSEDISAGFVPIDVDVLAATVVNDLQGRAEEMHVTLTTTPFPPDLCQTYGIGRLIQQAIHNLVENAVKYTLAGGWVRVTVYPRDNWLDVLVADNGIGIPPDKQAQLFRPFYRAKDPRMAAIDGTGLGLSLVRMVAERHGGNVWYHSIPDQGTIFRLRLPCHTGA